MKKKMMMKKKMNRRRGKEYGKEDQFAHLGGGDDVLGLKADHQRNHRDKLDQPLTHRKHGGVTTFKKKKK